MLLVYQFYILLILYIYVDGLRLFLQ